MFNLNKKNFIYFISTRFTNTNAKDAGIVAPKTT